jgi:hypothetical protein
MQKVLRGDGRHVGELLGGLGGMQKVSRGDGRQVPDGGVGVLGGMQKELSGDGRQPLLGGLVGGLLLGAVGMQPPVGRAVPSTHDPPPVTPIGVAGKHPSVVSQICAVCVTDVLGAVLDGMFSTSVPSSTSPAEAPEKITNVQAPLTVVT